MRSYCCLCPQIIDTQLFYKHIPVTNNTHATVEAELDAVFS
jgi:hypothetical protein